jgi:hypothetical protein
MARRHGRQQEKIPLRRQQEEDVTSFLKDNINAKKYLAVLCNCHSLEAKRNAKGNLTRPRNPYCLKPTERKEILRWLKKLKFLNRYASNIK